MSEVFLGNSVQFDQDRSGYRNCSVELGLTPPAAIKDLQDFLKLGMPALGRRKLDHVTLQILPNLSLLQTANVGLAVNRLDHFYQDLNLDQLTVNSVGFSWNERGGFLNGYFDQDDQILLTQAHDLLKQQLGGLVENSHWQFSPKVSLFSIHKQLAATEMSRSLIEKQIVEKFGEYLSGRTLEFSFQPGDIELIGRVIGRKIKTNLEPRPILSRFYSNVYQPTSLV